MIEVKPTGIQINLSIEDAQALHIYLARSVLQNSEGCYSNPCASEAYAGNEQAKEAMRIRQTLMGCLEGALVKGIEDKTGWNNATRKYL